MFYLKTHSSKEIKPIDRLNNFSILLGPKSMKIGGNVFIPTYPNMTLSRIP